MNYNISTLLKRGDIYICSACRARQHHLFENAYCEFCGASFSNYNEVLIENLKDKDKDKLFDFFLNL